MRLPAAALCALTLPAWAATQVVVMDGVSYVPAALTVERGDTVVWRNKDPFPHTVTAAGKFDSGPIAAGGEWKLVLREPGVYRYLCTLHPNMQGTLTVK